MKKKENPNLRDEDIAAEFECDRSTVSKILKQKQWSEIREVSKDANALKMATLGIWISTAEQKQLTLTGEVIRQKALEFATLLGVLEDEFKASEDGTEKMRPLVINKSNMPFAFRHEGITSHSQLPVDYYNNEKAWMHQDIFKKFLNNLQTIFRIQERKILLFIDNAISYNINNYEDYPNIHLHFLPPNTTAHLQPMDAGIINAFKVHYKQLYIRQVIHDFDRGIEEPSKIDILQAIRLVKTAWDGISAETIKNCWRHTRILLLEHLVRIFPEMEPAFDEDLETQIIQIPEFIDTEEALDDERIIEFVKNPVVNDNEPNDFVDKEPKITFTKAKKSLNQLLSFTCQQSFMTNSFIKENDEAFFHDFLS
ncbi:9105_t:CDS:2 [Gigaspora margarita]|uniref:9105_t:CDS:1 n=1 Tax=Gigaspora margarita TaxID=4874 RepID=A0ABM8W2D3_GIGMA|nr:9105_t:CDS:2 [Gigaspora margarita]